MLCETCQSIDFVDDSDFGSVAKHNHYISHVQNTANLAFKPIRDENLEYRYFLHQPSFKHLTCSKDAGCYFCAAMWYAFKEPPDYWGKAPIDDQTADSETLPIVMRLWRCSDPEYLCFWRDIPEGEYIRSFCGACEIEMRRAPVPANPFSRFSHDIEGLCRGGRLLEVDWDTGSVVSLDLAQAWYRRCVRKHDACAINNHRAGSVPNLPSRVIDVKEEGTDPILYKPFEGETGEYVALSHCWGDTKPMLVTREASDQQALSCRTDREFALPPLAAWPKTFREAVMVVRKFKLQYLWIDNTGIIQGDQADWARESERMAQYFGNATFTIAAAWGDSDDQGLFHQRNPLLVRPLRLIAPSKTPVDAGFYVLVDGPIHNYDMVESYNTPLYSRAWVVQEEQLSRRILRFGARCISWTCFCTHSASENHYTGQDVRPYQYNGFETRRPMRIHQRFLDHGSIAHQHPRNPYFDVWYILVGDFTCRNMKFKHDVLPAISGLAQTFTSFMDADDQYVAGLWRKDLKLGLLWTADIEGTSRQILPKGRVNFDSAGFTGPSWSWISHCHKRIGLSFHYKILPGGPFNYVEYDSWLGTEIIGVSITHRSTKEPYGQVQSGRLHVKARLPTLHIVAEPYEPTSKDDERGLYITHRLGRRHTRRLTMEKTPFPRIRQDMVGTCEVDDVDDRLWRAHLRNGMLKATFLPLIMYRNDNVPTQLAGLALLPLGGYENEYLRIGRASVDIKNVLAVKDCTLPFTEVVIV